MRVLRNQTAPLLEDSIMLCAKKKGPGGESGPFGWFRKKLKLEGQLQAELDRTGTARSELRIGAEYVRCRALSPETCAT